MNKKTLPFYLCLWIIICSLIIGSGYNSNIVLSQPIEIDIEPAKVSYYTHDSIYIDNNADFVTLGFEGSGTSNDPYLIESLSISTTTSESCIFIGHITAHFVIRHCAFESDQETILVELYGLADNTSVLENNTFESTSSDTTGLQITFSDGVNITRNYFTTLEKAIYLYSCDNSIIDDNDLTHHDQALYLYSCLFATIVANYIYDSEIGVFIHHCNYLRMFNNTINNSFQSGILLSYADNCFIVGNHIETTTINPGLQLRYADDNIIRNNWFEACKLGVDVAGVENKRNIIHHNSFVDNVLMGDPPSQAADSGTETLWYDSDSSQGNYWSDASGGAYQIAGDALNSDLYPLPGYPTFTWASLDIPEFPADDSYEKNDDSREAKELAINAEYNSLILLDEDYFSLSLERFYTLTVTIDYNLIEGILQVVLKASNKSVILNFLESDPVSGFSFDYDCPYTGTYYLCIRPYNLDVPNSTYDLDIRADYNFDIDDIYEENDVFAEATEYSSDSIEQELIYTDKDYYKVTLENNTDFTVYIEFDNTDVDLDLYFLPHDYDGNPANILAQSVTDFQTEEFHYVIDGDNDYIILVTSKDIDGIPVKPIDYTLTIVAYLPAEPYNSVSFIFTIVSLISLAAVWKKFKK